VKAPIPGQITRLLVTPGEMVQAGQPLLVLEAMKMQNEIFAQAAGVVQAVHVSAGKTVKRGDILLELR
jgi:biotin carboxyl carrier protein